MKLICEDCNESYISKGHKIGNDPGMPCSCWGAYLPGDEPGLRCRITDELCEDEVNVEDCPQFEEITEFVCTLSKLENYCEEQCESILVNRDTEIAICPECDEEINYEKIGETIVVGVTNLDKISEYNPDLTEDEKRIIRSNLERIVLLNT